MPFDPYLAKKLEPIRDLSREALASDPVAQQRMIDYVRDPAEWTIPQVIVENLRIEGRHGPIPIRTYRPPGTPATALLWAHGGGFSFGDLEMPEAHVVSAELAARAGAFVASVDYRLAQNGVRYPVPLDDVDAAWRWLTTDAMPHHPAAIGGASAGAALALAAALRERDRGRPAARLLLLAYPFAHYPNPALDDAAAAEMSALPPFMRFPAEAVEGMVRNYVGRISDLPPYALPGAARLDALPATHILLSEYDDLRASGELLERQLRAAGVPVSTYLAKGMPHGHLNRTPSLGEVDASLGYFAAALRALGGTTGTSPE
ncbi:alpha/beta hydrolase [Nonomuraea basaltis]|uniref:alpha/beta hydrolase n=1 Tax=Nonomuraea basaltis TaxID=2495887 RepID=UPI00110C5F7B|nr:alpha/beta hydrolase fold domain-containing protein [Nonomuraea basaltis]TMR88944.1 alpha/beta hydrolase [Nonomuraea basaltis]